MGMSGGNNGGAMAEINVTPLVDVMLVLLIIFMVTAPMLNNSGIEIDLPRAEAPPLDDSTEDQLVLEMASDGSIFLNEEPTTWETVSEQLAALAKLKPDSPVFLRADGGVMYRDVARLLAIAKRSGMPRVGLVFDPSAAEPDEAD